MSAFKKYYVDTFRYRYANFNGRASRSEYWYFTLFNSVIILLLYLPLLFIMASMSNELIPSNDFAVPTLPGTFYLFSALYTLYALISIVPGLALVIRRLHDIGKSGVNFLFVLIPLVGAILMLVWLVTESQPGRNQWGPNPWEENPDSIKSMLVN